MTRDEQVEAWKQEILDLRSGWEYAFWTGRFPPALADYLRRIEELNALIQEHTG